MIEPNLPHPMRLRSLLLSSCALLPLTACSGGADVPSFTLLSSTIQDRGVIPRDHTCDGRGQPPVFRVQDLPADARVLALLMDDLDAPGPYVHWMAWNIPADAESFGQSFGTGAVVSLNSSNQPGYLPPCPPAGSSRPHRYHVQVYALTEPLSVRPPLSRSAFKQALQGKVIAKGELTATYQR